MWRSPVVKYLPTQLVSGGDTVIAVESEAYALNISDGSRKWTVKLDGNGSLTQPTVHEGRLYFGTQNNLIYCLNADTGSVEWTKDLNEGSPYPGVVRAVTVSSNSLMVATEKWDDRVGLSVSGKLYRLSLEDGGVVWKYDAKAEQPASARSGMSSAPIVADGTVYVSDALEGSVRAISFDGGALLWKASVANGAGVLVSPVVLGNHVVFGSGDGVVTTVDAGSGTTTTSRKLGGAIVELRPCGDSLVAATWGTAVKLGPQTLDVQRINGRMTLGVTSKLADSPDHTSLIGFDQGRPVAINCDK